MSESTNFELSQILDTITTGIFILDKDWRYTYINDEGARLVRRTRDSLIGQRIWDAFPEAVDSTFYHKYREAFDTMQPVAFEAYFVPLDAWYDVHVHPSPNGLFVYFQDVSQRRQAVAQLRFQSEILSQITNAVVATDAGGRITYWNSAAERFFGYLSDEALGRPLREIAQYEWFSPDHERDADEALATSGEWHGEIRHHLRDGTPVILMASVRQLVDEQGAPAGVLGVLRDFTRKRQVEQELEARLRQQAAITELSRLALSDSDLDRIFIHASRLLGRTLEVEFAKVLELLPQRNALLLRAGLGWRPDRVGSTIVDAGSNSQSGFTLLAREPVVVEDLSAETRFSASALLTEHEIKSGMSVVIGDIDHPFGVLAAHSRQSRCFSQDDVHFLQVMAGVLATTVERKKVEAALQASEASLRQQAQILDQIHDAVVSTDLDGFITSWNKGAERLFGYPAEEVLGRHISRVYGEEGHDLLNRGIIEHLKERGVLEAEVRMRRKSGEFFFAHIALSTLCDDDGNAIGLIGYSLDITARIRAESERQDLLAREQTARRVAEHAAEAARRLQVVTDSTLAHLALDDLLGRLLDNIRDLLAVDTLAILLTTNDGVHLKVRVARGIEEVDLTSEFQSTIGQGMSGRIAGTGLPMVIDDVAESDLRSPLLRAEVRSAAGVPLLIEDRVIGVLRAGSVVPRKFTQDDLRLLQIVADRLALAIDRARLAEAEHAARTEANASNLLASSLDYELTLKDLASSAVPDLADWCSIFMSENTGQLQMIALAVADQVDEALAEEIERRFSLDPDRHTGVPNVFRTGEVEIVRSVSVERLQALARNAEEMELLRNAHLASVINVPLRVRDKTIGVMSLISTDAARRYGDADLILVQDLAQRASLAIDNGRLYREVHHALQVRDQFLSIAAHELKTPLTTVKGYVQLLNRYLHRPEMERSHLEESVEELLQQVKRLEILLGDLLDSSRIQQGRLNLRPEPMDLSALARQVLTRFEQAMERRDNHVLIIDAPTAVEGIWDYDRLDQILTNLISNALKYSPDGGQVRVSVRRDGEDAVLEVSDQGIGMSAEDQNRLFEPFTRSETARRTADGTGLGLYISRQMVEQHGGTISVESTLGVGTTFALRLPGDSSFGE